MFRASAVAGMTAAPLVAAFAITPLPSTTLPPGDIDAAVQPFMATRNLETAVQATNFALEFDGFDDQVDLSPGPIGTPTSVTVESWIRLDGTDKLHVLVTYAASEFNDGFTLFVAPTDQPAFVVASSSTNTGTVIAATPLEVGTWYHLAGVFDAAAGQVKIFVNGVEEHSLAFGGAIRHESGRDLLLGAQHKSFMRSGRFFRGALDEVRIWDRARTADELIADMEHELAGNESGLIGYWPLNEGTGVMTADGLSLDNAGELINGPKWIEATWRKDRERLVAIDVKPGDLTNMIPLQSGGKIPVAIVASAEFDPVGEIDPMSLTFGKTGLEESLHLRGLDWANCGSEDVNADGLPDLVCHFDTQKTAFEAGDNKAALKGIARTAGAFRGEDWINAFDRE